MSEGTEAIVKYFTLTKGTGNKNAIDERRTIASKAATSTKKKRIAAHDERAALPFEERRKGRIYSRD